MPAEFHRRALALLVLPGLLRQLAAVRVSSFDADEHAASGQQSPETCSESLQAVFRTVTFRDLYSPLLDGAYRIRNRFSGEYLTANEDGFTATTLFHVYSSGMSDWKLDRVKAAGTPVYTLRNRKSNRYLVAQGTGVQTAAKKVNASGHWSIALAPSDGAHRVIRLPSNGNLALGSLATDMLQLGDRSDTEDALESLLRGEWLLEWMPSWWRIPQSDEDGYKKQWKVAGNIPIFTGTEYTWLDLCAEDTANDCAGLYATGRERLSEVGILAESTRRYVTQNLFSGSCDMFWSMTKFLFLRSSQIVAEMRTAAGKECAAQTIKQVSMDLKTAIMADCYDACLTTIRQVAANMPCVAPENATAVFEEILSHGTCDGIGNSALEALTEFAVGENCFTYTPPHPLWTAELFDTTSLTVADGNPVCAVPAGKESSRNSADLVMNRANGVCVSGTTCQCPGGLVTEKKSTLRLQTDTNIFISSDSSLEAIIQDQFFKQSRKVALRVLVFGSSVGGAILAIPLGITFLPKQLWMWGNYLVDALAFRCTQSVGCWPVEPTLAKTEESTKACRMPDMTKEGGSLVWFMPPPGVKIQTKKWYKLGRRCEFSPCTTREIRLEKIGFIEQAVFNCQRIPYEEMTATQQDAYLVKLRETLPAEYATEI